MIDISIVNSLHEKHIARRQELLNEYEFVSVTEIADMLTFERIADQSALDRIRDLYDQHLIIGVDVEEELRFPTLQIDPETGFIFEAIQQFLPIALKTGYTHWEIVSWLVTEQSRIPAYVGKPAEVEYSGKIPNAETVMAAVKKTTPKLEVSKFKPITQIMNKDSKGFEESLRHWIG